MQTPVRFHEHYSIFYCSRGPVSPSSSLVEQIVLIRDSLKRELDGKKFISRQVLQDILPRDKVRQLLRGNTHEGRDDASEHISSNALKFLALLILQGDDRHILTYLDNPLDITDDEHFGNAKRYDDQFYHWKEPTGTSIHDALRDGHWKIPPVLDPNFTIKYPHGFIPPFHDAPQPWRAASSFPVFKAQVGGGHLELCDAVIFRDKSHDTSC
jgi:hypothetical protein